MYPHKHSPLKSQKTSGFETLRNVAKTKSQAAALQILKRQDNSEKKSRLRYLLENQFLSKYGSKHETSPLNAVIKREIEIYVNGLDDILDGERDLPVLEDKIKRALDSAKAAASEKKKEANKQSAAQAESNASKNNGESNPESSNNAASVTSAFSAKDWLIFNAIVDVSRDDEHNRREMNAYKNRQTFRADLDKQLTYKEQKKLQERSEKAKLLEDINKELEVLQVDQENAKKKRLEDFEKDRISKLSQIEFNEKLREKERQERLAQETLEIARTRKLLEADEEAKRQKIRNEKKRQDAIIIENERNKAMREEAQRQAREYDIKLAHDYE